MQQTDWSNVKLPEPEPPPQPAGLASKLIAVVVTILAIAAAVVLLTMVLLGGRIRERTIDACNGPSCVLELRTAHDDCYMDSLAIGAPTSLADFRTEPDANRLGFLRVDYAAYLACTGIAKKLTNAPKPGQPRP